MRCVLAKVSLQQVLEIARSTLLSLLALAVVSASVARGAGEAAFLGVADDLVLEDGAVVYIGGEFLQCGLVGEDAFAACGTEGVGEFELIPDGEIDLGSALLAMPAAPAPPQSTLKGVDRVENGLRNPDPNTGRPRVHGSGGDCTTGDPRTEPACWLTDVAACQSDPHPNCEFGANNAEAFDDLCQWSRGSSPLDPSRCGLSLFGSHALYSGEFPVSQLLAQIGRGSSSAKPLSIIADHTAVAEYENIPQSYIDEVKKMLVSFAGESHGQGPLYGLEDLGVADPRFPVSVKWWTGPGGPEAPTDQHLRVQREFWRGGSWEYGAGEQHTWTSEEAIDMTNDHFAHADALGTPYDAFVWGWCWDMTAGQPAAAKDPVYGVGWAGRSFTLSSGDLGRWGLDSGDAALTGNSLSTQSYLDAWVRYQSDNPSIAIIFSTGPVGADENDADLEENTGERGYQRYLKHEYIRNWVKTNGGYLFDYADILTHNDAGELSTTAWNGHVYPYIHPDNDGEYGGSQNASCHIGQAGALRLGKALWVLLAKIKGWDGSSEAAQGAEGAKDLFSALTGFTPAEGSFPDLNGDGLVDNDDLPLVALVDDDQVDEDEDGPLDGGPLWVVPPQYDPTGDDAAFVALSGDPHSGLSAALSNEQEALLGCGSFWTTHCDYHGIDLFETEASAFLQSFVGLEGTPGDWRTDDDTEPQPGTAGFEGGAVCTVGDIGGSADPSVKLPGCRGPGPDGVPDTADDDPGYEVARDGTPPNAARNPKDIGGHPFTGQPWQSEMAAFSWNAMMMLVGLSGAGKPPEERLIDEFSPLQPLRTDGCSFLKPQRCSAVQALVSYTGVTPIGGQAGGNDLFGRRVWLWQTGAKYTVASATGEFEALSGDRPGDLHAFGPSFLHGGAGQEEVPLLAVSDAPEPSLPLLYFGSFVTLAVLAGRRRIR